MLVFFFSFLNNGDVMVRDLERGDLATVLLLVMPSLTKAHFFFFSLSSC